MKKRFFVKGLLLACCLEAFAEKSKSVRGLLYTIDKEIPSCFKVIDKDCTSPKTTELRERHIRLEKMLNLNDETNAILKDTLTDKAGGFHESCVEYYQGIEVEGTRFTIHYDNKGVPSMANGNFRTIKNLQTLPVISESDALKRATIQIGAIKYSWEDQKQEQPKGKLVVYFKDDIAYLAYKFAINAVTPQSSQYVFIDAKNGQFLGAYSAECPIISTVMTRFSGPVGMTSQYYNGNYILRDYTRGLGIVTFDSSWQDYMSSSSTWSDMSYFNRSALDVHWGIESTYDFYYDTFGRNSYDNNGGIITSLVNITDFDNAAWNSHYKVNKYGFWNYSQNLPLVTLDITAHKYTHGVTEETSNLIYQCESGALDEGMSDIFAVCVENMVKPLKGDSIWMMGEDVFLLRNLMYPTCKYYHGNGWIDTNQTPTYNNDYCGVRDVVEQD